MTKQEFIAKYEGWFSYTRREELKEQMEDDLEAVFKALRQPPVSGRSEQFECDEIWRPNIPDDGCKTQCKECAEKQKQSNCH